MKASNIFLITALAVTASGCKTLDSVKNNLGSLTSNIIGEKVTPEQIQLAVAKAQLAYESAESKFALVEAQGLKTYDPEGSADVNKIWRELQANYQRIKNDNSQAVKKASLFRTVTYSESIAKDSHKLIAWVDRTLSVKTKVLKILQPVRERFAVLDKLDTKRNFATKYGQLNKKQDYLINLLTKDDEAQVLVYIPTMLLNMEALEKDAVVKYYLGAGLVKLKELANSDKAKVLPEVYHEVRVLSESSVAFSKVNFRDYQAIAGHAKQLDHQLARVESLYAQYAQNKTLKLIASETSFESYLLGHEKQLLALTQAAGLGDLRHLSFKQQLEQLTTKL